jgi:hypothetical protein
MALRVGEGAPKLTLSIDGKPRRIAAGCRCLSPPGETSLQHGGHDCFGANRIPERQAGISQDRHAEQSGNW